MKRRPRKTDNRHAAILYRLEVLSDYNPKLQLRDILSRFGFTGGLSDEALAKKLAHVEREAEE